MEADPSRRTLWIQALQVTFLNQQLLQVPLVLMGRLALVPFSFCCQSFDWTHKPDPDWHWTQILTLSCVGFGQYVSFCKIYWQRNFAGSHLLYLHCLFLRIWSLTGQNWHCLHVVCNHKQHIFIKWFSHHATFQMKILSHDPVHLVLMSILSDLITSGQLRHISLLYLRPCDFF